MGCQMEQVSGFVATHHAKHASFTGGCLNFRLGGWQMVAVVVSMALTCSMTERRSLSVSATYPTA
jgi:hypothetical protein